MSHLKKLLDLFINIYEQNRDSKNENPDRGKEETYYKLLLAALHEYKYNLVKEGLPLIPLQNQDGQILDENADGKEFWKNTKKLIGTKKNYWQGNPEIDKLCINSITNNVCVILMGMRTCVKNFYNNYD